jgi:hypothetical protein
MQRVSNTPQGIDFELQMGMRIMIPSYDSTAGSAKYDGHQRKFGPRLEAQMII